MLLFPEDLYYCSQINKTVLQAANGTESSQKKTKKARKMFYKSLIYLTTTSLFISSC